MSLMENLRSERKAQGFVSDLTFDDLPVGTRVKVRCAMQDFHFFNGDTGKVIVNSGDYLGIRVEFDQPRHYANGPVMLDFNFNPEDLDVLAHTCPDCRCGPS